MSHRICKSIASSLLQMDSPKPETTLWTGENCVNRVNFGLYPHQKQPVNRVNFDLKTRSPLRQNHPVICVNFGASEIMQQAAL